MEQLLKKRSVRLTGCALNKQEECPISGEYTLPEYCPDIAVVLKCFAYPRILNRQWSGDQLLLDGSVVIRALYLDEGRRCVRAIEFTQAFSCALRGEGRVSNAAVNLELCTKYLNCRAVNPRRIEVRGAIIVDAYAESSVQKDISVANECSGLYTRTQTKEITAPCSNSDKILTISESLDFPDDLPAAEMLLGGECHAVMRECKLLAGKAIVKGQVYLHQMYVDAHNVEMVHCLNFSIPFSQILDVDGAVEGMPYTATVHVLSDTERCTVGPGGENTILEVSVKLLAQVQVYQKEEIPVLLDAYHTKYPLSAQTEETDLRCLLGTRWEETVLPMQISVSSGRWHEILDVNAQLQEHDVVCSDGRAEARGRMTVCVIARDTDGEIVCDEFAEDYSLSYSCRGNAVSLHSVPIDYTYRMVDSTLELKVVLCVAVTDAHCEKVYTLSDLHLKQDTPYPKQKATVLFYYADAEESVWDIGRNCHTSPKEICEENSLTGECISDSTVLVVPIVN